MLIYCQSFEAQRKKCQWTSWEYQPWHAHPIAMSTQFQANLVRVRAALRSIELSRTHNCSALWSASPAKSIASTYVRQVRGRVVIRRSIARVISIKTPSHALVTTIWSLRSSVINQCMSAWGRVRDNLRWSFSDAGDLGHFQSLRGEFRNEESSGQMSRHFTCCSIPFRGRIHMSNLILPTLTTFRTPESKIRQGSFRLYRLLPPARRATWYQQISIRCSKRKTHLCSRTIPSAARPPAYDMGILTYKHALCRKRNSSESDHRICQLSGNDVLARQREHDKSKGNFTWCVFFVSEW